MKISLLLTFALSASALAESAIPKPFGKERYDETYAKSPFALATPVEKAPEPPDNEFANLVVTGIGKLEDGRSYVIVHKVGDDTDMRFEGDAQNHDGYAVKEVKQGEKWRD